MTSPWKQKSTWIFLTLAFAVPWAGWITAAILAARHYNSSLLTWLFYCGDFCAIAGIIATFIDGGWRAVRALARSCFRWKVSPGWWIYALFLPCAWSATALLVWGITHGGVGPVRILQVLSLFAPARFIQSFSTGPLGEEAGWRGFLLPRLVQRYTPLTASLLLGLIWSFWHVPLYYSTMIALPAVALRFFISTTCISVLIAILFFRARRSLLLTMLLHYTYNVWPPVLALVLPGIHLTSRGPSGWISTGLILGVTAGAAHYLGPQLGCEQNVQAIDALAARA
jgi:membrane protease YdiL (CAAX protease family)